MKANEKRLDDESDDKDDHGTGGDNNLAPEQYRSLIAAANKS